MKILKFIKNKAGDVPWMWFIIGAIIAILLIVLGFRILGGAEEQSRQVFMIFSGS